MYGIIGFTTRFLLVSIFNHINKIDNEIADILFCAYLGAEFFGRYKICKDKFYLGFAIAGASIMHFINYALVTIGVWG